MSEVTSAVTRAVNELTDFRAAQVMQTTFSEAVSNTGKAGLENNKTKSAETLVLIADIRSTNMVLGDVIADNRHLIRTMKEVGTSMLPCFPDRLRKQISKGETRIRECQAKMNKLVTIVPDNCTVTDQLASDFYTCKKRFDEVKLRSKHFLPSSEVELERSPGIPTSLLLQMVELQPCETPARRIKKLLDKKLELGQATTSLHEVNTLMHMDDTCSELAERKSTVEEEDHKTENSSTCLEELTSSGPPGQWGDSRKISTLPEEPPGLTDANSELEDYTGIKELFAEPDPLVPLQPASTPGVREVNAFMPTEKSTVKAEDPKMRHRGGRKRRRRRARRKRHIQPSSSSFSSDVKALPPARSEEGEEITESFRGYNLFNDTEESPVGCEDTNDFLESDEDLSNFQCREMSPPDPEIQIFKEPLGILPSCPPHPLRIGRTAEKSGMRRSMRRTRSMLKTCLMR